MSREALAPWIIGRRGEWELLPIRPWYDRFGGVLELERLGREFPQGDTITVYNSKKKEIEVTFWPYRPVTAEPEEPLSSSTKGSGKFGKGNPGKHGTLVTTNVDAQVHDTLWEDISATEIIADSGCRRSVANETWHRQLQEYLATQGLQPFKREIDEEFRFGGGDTVRSREAFM